MKEPDLWPVKCSYDPIDMPIKFNHDGLSCFQFLRDECRYLPFLYQVPILRNCNVIYPTGLRIDWPTFIPAAAQSMHWKEAEETATALINEVTGLKSRAEGSLPSELEDFDSKASKRKELIDTTISASIHIFPAGNVQRAKLIAKANLIIAMHDGNITPFNYKLKFGIGFSMYLLSVMGSLIIQSYEMSADSIIDVIESKFGLKKTIVDTPIFKRFAGEVIEEDPVVGPELVKGITSWVKHTREKPPSSMEFKSLSAYIDYRILDFAVDYCEAAIMFTCEITRSRKELSRLTKIRKLVWTHLSLVNDLYSYEKEMCAERKKGDVVINAVRVLENLLAISSREAKVILRGYIWNLEVEINEEYRQALYPYGSTGKEWRFVEGMMLAMAGNLFFSATCLRYAKPTLECVGSGVADQRR
ncbi:terpenoid synthase [Hypoxylon trugodes]|uniref:terpenoid synthase n=1 Tax=Hypoxylon trugodes TaxID=326681 RepID=UPI00218D3BE6|nr:terpenoid synthase [Hypoxylon trugodes]KAI1394194.1 terpenoid synthase [Hypoxylon trugodes]